MRLLFDEQLSEELVTLLADPFPGSLHVRSVGVGGAADPAMHWHGGLALTRPNRGLTGDRSRRALDRVRARLIRSVRRARGGAPMSWRKYALRFTSVLAMTLFGCSETPISEVLRGSRELPQTRGRITAREALDLVYPAVLETSKKPVLLLITSGTDISAEGRSGTWELVFHFPARFAQGVYSLEHGDPEVSDGGLRMRWRLSPRPDVKGEDAALPLDFTDSPEAVRDLNRAGVDWVAGDADMTLATKRLPSGEVVWATESHGKEFATAFVVSIC